MPPSPELPAPLEGPISREIPRAPESTPEKPAIESAPSGNAERKSSAVEKQPQAAAQDPPHQDNTMATPVDDVIQPQPAVATIADSDSPDTASDGDVIEAEWVSKAKDVVNKTKSDPYLQDKEISKIQAEYLKKRYNKEIKTAKD